jgi:hypothetical protein
MIRSALLLSAAALMAAPAFAAQEMLQPVAHEAQDAQEPQARDPLADLLDDLDSRRQRPAPAQEDEPEAGEDDPFGLEEDEEVFEDEPADQPNPFGFDPEDEDDVDADAPIETAPLDPDQDFDPLNTPQIDLDSPEGAAAALGRPVELSSEPGSLAVLRGLDKVTARTADFEAPIGETVQFGGLEVTVQYCRRRPPEEPPEIFAFVQIDDPRTQTAASYRQMGLTAESAAQIEEDAGGPARWLFSGWMFGSNPALNALEHPVYDVWVIDCRS